MPAMTETTRSVLKLAAEWLTKKGADAPRLDAELLLASVLKKKRLDLYLDHFGARRVVHGHTPHWENGPTVGHDGRLWYPTIGKSRIREFSTTPWGRLFQAY